MDLENRTAEDLLALGCRYWNRESGLMLLPAGFLSQLRPGTILYSIRGEKKIVGQDDIEDTKRGLLAVGVYHRDAKKIDADALARQREAELERYKRHLGL